ncbi:MAG: translocation/assembly module TamB domain-containing protein [Alistipes sp.]
MPIILSLLLDIPVVQNYIVQKATAFASRKLETTVSIGRVDIGLFNKLKADDFYVEDYQGDTLLYVGHVEAFVAAYGFGGGGLILGRAQVENAKFHLHETPSGEMNIKQITDRMSNPNKPSTGSFKLTITSAHIDGLEFCLEQIHHKDPPYGIDFSHMHLLDICADVSNLTIDGSTIATNIRSLACRERSGFVLNDLSGHFYLTSGCLGFENLNIKTPQSQVRMPHVSLVGDSWAEYKNFISAVQLDAAIEQSRLSSDDVAFFAPALRSWHTTLTNINVAAVGTVDNFVASTATLNAGPATQLVLEGSVRGLPDLARTHFDVDVRKLTSSASDINKIVSNIGRTHLSQKLLRILDNAGRIDLAGSFVGTLKSFRMQSALATKAGLAKCNLSITPLTRSRSRVQGDVSALGIRFGQLLDVPKLGEATLTAQVQGEVGADFADADLSGQVTRLVYAGYAYDSMRLDGHLYNKKFNGRISARDPNLKFDFDGVVDLNDSVPRYDFALNLLHANLVKMHINPRDSISELSTRMVAKVTGRSVDDLNGEIRITDVVYRYNDRQVKARELTLRGENSARSKYVALRSDFADATFRSKTSYRKVYEYLKMSAWKYLPMLYDRDKYVSQTLQQTAVADDYSLLSVQIKNINPLVDAFSRGLQIADGSQLQLLFNPAGDKLSLKVASDYVERDQLLATKININVANRGDSLSLYAATEDLYIDAFHLVNFSVTGGARQGRLQLSAGFNDTLRRVSGLFGFSVAVKPTLSDAGRVLSVRILPSHLTRGNKTWQVFARRIELDTARVVVDHFVVMNDQQELLIDGTASRSRADSVLVRLSNFDLAPFTQIVERMGYSIEGVTNGAATIKSALRDSEITADILLDSVKVNSLPAPPMRLTSIWNFKQNRAGIVVANRMKQDTLVQGFYDPSQVRYYAKLAVDSLDVGLINPILKGVISETKGSADVKVALIGQRRNAELMGSIQVRDFSTKVDFTQVTYKAPKVLFDVQKNHLRVADVSLFDPEGNEGKLDFDLNLSHLSNISYKVQVTPKQMLVLNTSQQDNDLFYGRVYASGAATISGDKRGVNMDIAGTTEDNSSFFMPLSNKSNISSANFVTFVEPKQSDTLNYLARKKMLFERRKQSKTAVESAMNISLALNVRPNLDFQMMVAGNVIKGRGEGLLNLQINPRQNIFEMYGDYTIAEGSFLFSMQNILTRNFIIENGSTIQWTGSPMNAMLDINALYKLKASLAPLMQGTTTSSGGDRAVPVECSIHLGERLQNPSMDFNVNVPSSDAETQAVISNALNTPEAIQTQFACLLLSSSFMSENSSAFSNFGVSTSAATGIGFLTSQLNKLISMTGYNVMIDYRPKSELTSDELDFGLSKSLVNNRLFVELEGNYVVDNKQAVNRNMSNFMGEAYITWLIDRTGSLKLKGFTQTIDRFDENQGLQETGVGIYYKEDFNNFKDLRRRIKDRFTSKKRKEKRELRRQMALQEQVQEQKQNQK